MLKFALKTAIVASVLLLAVVAAKSQGAVNYRFLEVVDYAGKPVPDAVVKVTGSCVAGDYRTDAKGQLAKGLPIGFGDCQTDMFGVSKDGYFPFTDFFDIIAPNRSTYRMSYEPLRLELLLMPKTAAQRRAIGDEQRKRELFVAARTADPAKVKSLLDSGLKANLQTSDLRGVPAGTKAPLIEYALRSGDGETVSLILDKGAKIQEIPDALTIFVETGPFRWREARSDEEKLRLGVIFEKTAKRLIDSGASTTAANYWGLTPLMLAAKNGYLKIVGDLLARGVAVDAKDKSGRTALMLMPESSKELKTRSSIAKLLIAKGANPNMITEGGFYYGQKCQSPLINAVFHNDAEIAAILIEGGANVSLECKNGDSPLNYARKLQNDGFADYRSVLGVLEAAANK